MREQASESEKRVNRIGNSVISVATVLALSACGGANQPGATMDAAADKRAGQSMSIPSSAKPVPVAVVSVKGALVAKLKGTTPRDLTSGGVGVADSLFATGRGAIFELGTDASFGRVWLRGGSELAVGSDNGALYVSLRSGEARFKPASGRVKAFAKSGGELIAHRSPRRHHAQRGYRDSHAGRFRPNRGATDARHVVARTRERC